MAQDPYRRPGVPAPERPRGIVVRRADEPEALEEAERRRREARYRVQSIVAQAEHESAQRSTDRRARLAGAALVVVALALAALTVRSLGEGYYHPRTVAMVPGLLFAGVWAIAVGAGGASTIDSLPPWVKIGGVASFVVGAVWGATGFLDVLGWLAR